MNSRHCESNDCNTDYPTCQCGCPSCEHVRMSDKKPPAASPPDRRAISPDDRPWLLVEGGAPADIGGEHRVIEACARAAYEASWAPIEPPLPYEVQTDDDREKCRRVARAVLAEAAKGGR